MNPRNGFGVKFAYLDGYFTSIRLLQGLLELSSLNMKREFNNRMKICFVGNLSSTFQQRDFKILNM